MKRSFMFLYWIAETDEMTRSRQWHFESDAGPNGRGRSEIVQTCVHVCIHVCMNACMYVLSVYVRMHACTYRTHVWMHVCI